MFQDKMSNQEPKQELATAVTASASASGQEPATTPKQEYATAVSVATPKVTNQNQKILGE